MHWLILSVMVVAAAALGAYVGGSYVMAIYRDGVRARAASPDAKLPYRLGWRAAWWRRGFEAQDDVLGLDHARRDRHRYQDHLEAFGGGRAVANACQGNAPPDPAAMLRQAETTYLARSGWARAPDGDHWAGEAWASPWEITYQLSRPQALLRQRQRDVEASTKLAVVTGDGRAAS